MRKPIVIILVVAVLAATVGLVIYRYRAPAPVARDTSGGGPGGGPGGGFGGRGGGGSLMGRSPMTVELVKVARATVTDEIMVVGNLIGAATVEVVPKASGRLQTVNVRLGDSLREGQLVAKVEDRELREQVRQAQASYEVSQATIRQREADLRFAQTSLDRSKSLFARDLVAKQTLDDSDARYQAAEAQLDLARAQFEQTKARLDELNINLANTNIVSPVDGFVGRRNLDPGAYVSQNTPVISAVDIRFVRLVANLVEKDLPRVGAGMTAVVEVDAYPGETFMGRVARLAPVLDPATRTAQMEVEVPNPTFRLKPGMYARVRFTVARHENALVVPRNALVTLEGKRGVFVANGKTASFRAVELGIMQPETVEVANGVTEADQVITTGAAALRDGDTILLPGGQGGASARGGEGGARGAGRQGGGRPGQGAAEGGRPTGGTPPAGRQGPGGTE